MGEITKTEDIITKETGEAITSALYDALEAQYPGVYPQEYITGSIVDFTRRADSFIYNKLHTRIRAANKATISNLFKVLDGLEGWTTTDKAVLRKAFEVPEWR